MLCTVGLGVVHVYGRWCVLGWSRGCRGAYVPGRMRLRIGGTCLYLGGVLGILGWSRRAWGAHLVGDTVGSPVVGSGVCRGLWRAGDATWWCGPVSVPCGVGAYAGVGGCCPAG